MKSQMGFDAGAVWDFLAAQEGPVSMKKLAAAMKKEHGLTPTRVYLALGWLAREDKVRLTGKDPAHAEVGLEKAEKK